MIFHQEAHFPLNIDSFPKHSHIAMPRQSVGAANAVNRYPMREFDTSDSETPLRRVSRVEPQLSSQRNSRHDDALRQFTQRSSSTGDMRRERPSRASLRPPAECEGETDSTEVYENGAWIRYSDSSLLLRASHAGSLSKADNGASKLNRAMLSDGDSEVDIKQGVDQCRRDSGFAKALVFDDQVSGFGRKRQSHTPATCRKQQVSDDDVCSTPSLVLQKDGSWLPASEGFKGKTGNRQSLSNADVKQDVDQCRRDSGFVKPPVLLGSSHHRAMPTDGESEVDVKPCGRQCQRDSGVIKAPVLDQSRGSCRMITPGHTSAKLDFDSGCAGEQNRGSRSHSTGAQRLDRPSLKEQFSPPPRSSELSTSGSRYCFSLKPSDFQMESASRQSSSTAARKDSGVVKAPVLEQSRGSCRMITPDHTSAKLDFDSCRAGEQNRGSRSHSTGAQRLDRPSLKEQFSPPPRSSELSTSGSRYCFTVKPSDFQMESASRQSSSTAALEDNVCKSYSIDKRVPHSQFMVWLFDEKGATVHSLKEEQPPGHGICVGDRLVAVNGESVVGLEKMWIKHIWSTAQDEGVITHLDLTTPSKMMMTSH